MHHNKNMSLYVTAPKFSHRHACRYFLNVRALDLAVTGPNKAEKKK